MDKITVKDIARELGLSVGTVYRSLNNTGRVSAKTKSIVLEQARKMGFQPNTIAQGLAKRKKFHIVVLLPNDVPTWWDSVKSGVEKAERSLSEFGTEVTIMQYSFLSSTNSPIGILDFIKNNEIDGIIMVPSIHREVLKTLDYAKSKNIPVACVNADVQSAQRLFYYGPDEEQVGTMAGDLIGSFIKKNGNICLLGVESNDFYRLALRKAGAFNQLCKYYPNINITNTYAFPLENLEKHIEEMLAEHADDISGIYVYDSLALETTAKVLKKNRIKHIAVVGHECLDECSRYIDEGYITATLCQETISQGYHPLKLLYSYLLSHVEIQPYYYSNVNIVTRGNLKNLLINENGCGFK